MENEKKHGNKAWVFNEYMKRKDTQPFSYPMKWVVYRASMFSQLHDIKIEKCVKEMKNNNSQKRTRQNNYNQMLDAIKQNIHRYLKIKILLKNQKSFIEKGT